MLSTEQITPLNRYRDRWADWSMSCAPADRNTAEAGVRLAYEAAGIAPPKRIEWCGGPVEIADALASMPANEDIGPNLRQDLFERIRGNAALLSEIFWDEALTQCSETSISPDHPLEERDRTRAGAIAINRAVVAAANARLNRAYPHLRQALARFRGRSRILPRHCFLENALGPAELTSLAFFEYLHDVRRWQDETRSLRGLWMIGKSAGWIVPYKNVCWVADRPETIHVDHRGRLHCADGPALRYRDAWTHWAWKGVAMPRWAIEHPERVTATEIDDATDPIARRCLIDIMTPERFIAGNPQLSSTRDETGKLWRATWRYRGVVIDTWAAVEVVDGTPGPDGARKHYVLPVPATMRTAREAVAWSYGMAAERYAELELRT